MVSIDGSIRIIDFGLARYVENVRKPITEGVCTKYYRPPEILFGANLYGKSVDVWSCGCILAELFLGQPFFQGSTDINQLSKIFGIRGTPTVTFYM